MKIFTHKKQFLAILTFSASAILLSCSTRPPIQVQAEQSGAVANERVDVDPEALQHFMDGQLLMSQGDYALAILEFQDALSADSSVASIHMALAESYWHLGKVERSEAHLKEALRLDPEDSQASEMLAHQYILRKMYDPAVDIYRKLWTSQPNNTDYGYALANLAKISNDLEQALAIYLKIHEQLPGSSVPLENAAQIALARQNLKLSQELFTKLTELEPDNTKYLRTLSDLAILNGDFETGLNYLKQLIDLEDGDIDLQIRLGTLYYENDQVDKALEYFMDLYREGNKTPGLLYFLSSLSAETGALDQAWFFAEESIRSFPDEPRGYSNLALLALQQNLPDSAIAILKNADRFVPGDFTINFLLGNSYYQVKDDDNAQYFLEQSLGIFPESRHARQTLALIYDRTEQWIQSDSLYEILVQNEPDDAQALNNYAYSLVERNLHLEHAREMAEKAIQIEPENAAYLDTAGWIYFKLGDYKKALSLLQSAVELDDSNPVILEHLGDVLILKKQFTKARSIYQQAVELEPDNERLRSKAQPD
ncbi:MAG: tetratricopeptide repeat protein [Candidatus Neomarinimicrobiota bacterium]